MKIKNLTNSILMYYNKMRLATTAVFMDRTLSQSIWKMNLTTIKVNTISKFISKKILIYKMQWEWDRLFSRTTAKIQTIRQCQWIFSKSITPAFKRELSDRHNLDNAIDCLFNGVPKLTSLLKSKRQKKHTK